MSKSQIVESVLEATNREAIQLTVGVPVDRGEARIQGASPGITITLKRRPDVGVRAAIVEQTISIAITS